MFFSKCMCIFQNQSVQANKYLFLQVFIGKIPKDTFEDVLVPLIEKCGRIYDVRLMMDPMSGLNRGYAFTTFCDKEGAQECVKQVRKIQMVRRNDLINPFTVPCF